MRDILTEEKAQVSELSFIMNEDNLKKILAQPLVGAGCDGSTYAPCGHFSKGKRHPRSYGSFPRLLAKYVREEKTLPLEEIIRKATFLAAERFWSEKRSILEQGYYADLAIFDPDKITDRATGLDPHCYPEGIEYILVNGRVVIEGGEHTGAIPGKILKKDAVR